MRLKSIIACIAVSPLLIAASEPVRIQPSSQWVLDYADNSCRLIRTFGEGDSQAKLVLESMGPGDLTMLVTGTALHRQSGAVRARLLPVDDEPFVGTAQRAEDGLAAALWTYVPLLQFDQQDPPASLLGVKPKLAHRSSLRPAALDLAKRDALKAQRDSLVSRTNELEIKSPSRAPIILETGSMAAPIKMLDQCERDLLHDLGLDPDIQDKVVRPVWTPDITRWLNSESYPRIRASRGQESRVNARLLVDVAGRVTNCTSLSKFNAPEFNKAVCDGLSQAVFQPAELADGTRVPSYYGAAVTFQMETSLP